MRSNPSAYNTKKLHVLATSIVIQVRKAATTSSISPTAIYVGYTGTDPRAAIDFQGCLDYWRYP